MSFELRVNGEVVWSPKEGELVTRVSLTGPQGEIGGRSIDSTVRWLDVKATTTGNRHIQPTADDVRAAQAAKVAEVIEADASPAEEEEEEVQPSEENPSDNVPEFDL